jgi:hypothetical protein
MGNGNAHYLFYGYSGTTTVVLRVELRFSSGAYQLRAALVNDGTTWSTTNWFTIADGPQAVELDWRAASAAGANNGGLTFWLNGVQQADLTGVDNDTRRIDRVRLGPVAGLDTGTRGTYFLDAFVSRRQTYIGLEPGAPATPTPTATATPTPSPTPSQTPAPTATGAPGGNRALTFDGLNDQVVAGAVPGTGPLTIEAWVRPGLSNANNLLLANADGSTGWSLELNNGQLTFWLATDRGWEFNRHTTPLAAGQWYHVAATLSGGQARTFVDGSAATATGVGTLMPGQALRFGGLAGYGFFNGTLDEVRLSNVARYSAAFTRPSGPFTPDANTLGLWHFDEGSGQQALDVSASANHATLGSGSGADSADPIWAAAGFQ